MFKLNPAPTFWTEVSISVPGAGEPAKFEVEYKWMPRDALRGYFGNAAGRSDEDLLGEIVCNWRGIDAEFSRENLAQLLANYTGAARALYDRYGEEMLEARKKTP